MELLELLRQGKVQDFNKARERHTTVEFFAEDLSEIKAAEADLSSVNMEKSDLTDADLTDAVLARAIMSGADLCNTKMSGIMGLKLKLKEAFAEKVDLRMADLSAASLSGTEFEECNLDATVLVHAKLKGCTLTKCTLKEADLTEAQAAHLTLSGCDLADAIVVDANLHESVFEECSLSGADFSRSRMVGAKFTGSDLSGAKFHGTNLTGADFTGAKLAGADLSRADLTDAVLDGVDLTGAVLTEAELAAKHLPPGSQPELPPAADFVVEEAQVAVGHEAVLLLWENPAEIDGRPRVRVAVAPLGAKKGPAVAPALPVPAELVLARSVASAESGFIVALLVERPGGAVLQLFPVDVDGTVGPHQSVRLPYTAAARPLLLRQDGENLLYGISREGPGVTVDALTDAGLEPRVRKGFAQVRGFASDHHPIVLSKGGVLVPLNPRGLGEPAAVPRGFPGRSFGACIVPDAVGIAWAGRGEKGLRYTEIGGRQTFEPLVLFPKDMVGAVDLCRVGEEVWAVVTREPESFGATSAWAVRLPAGTAVPILDDADQDVSEVAIHDGGGEPVVTLTTSDGGFEVFTVSGSKVRRRWRLG